MVQGRYELKFPVDVAKKEDFLKLARHAMQEDPHGTQAVYRVSSQYFDTSDYSAYWQKLDGESQRKKVRLRYYWRSNGEGRDFEFSFLEIKHRVNNTVYKERVRLKKDGARRILSDSKELLNLGEHVVEGDRSKKTVIEKIARLAQNSDFGPVHVISYLREAWIGKKDNRLRLTFDNGCRSFEPQDFLDVDQPLGREIIPQDKCIMEIKFDQAIPRWLRDVVAVCAVKLRRFSKYAAGVEALNLVNPDVRYRQAVEKEN